MRSNISRRAGAASLLFSLICGVTLTPATVFGQETGAQTQSTQTKKEKKTDKNKQQSSQPSTEQVAQANGRGALSPSEDPAMIGKRNINKGLGGWLGGSMEKEVSVGRQIAAEAEKELKLVDDTMITEYVNRVGQNVVNHSDAKVPFTIKVVDSDDVNAFALPGGFFYVNRGLILAADNESELAGVMAHEIAHVAARHAMENQGKATLMNYGMLAGIIFGGGILSPILQNAGGLLGGIAMLKFSRGAEQEADKLGVQYLYAAGYDPNGMATMFEKLASKNKKKPGSLQKLFSTHPQAPDRRDATIALVSRFPEREEYVMSTSEFQKMKKYLLRLSNAKASIAGDIDETENSRPTLKKRPQEDPNAPSTTPTDTTDETKKDGPPVLKKRTSDPVAQPSPNE
jgi:predicted Zn-dependent protease